MCVMYKILENIESFDELTRSLLVKLWPTQQRKYVMSTVVLCIIFYLACEQVRTETGHLFFIDLIYTHALFNPILVRNYCNYKHSKQRYGVLTMLQRRQRFKSVHLDQCIFQCLDYSPWAVEKGAKGPTASDKHILEGQH